MNWPGWMRSRAGCKSKERARSRLSRAPFNKINDGSQHTRVDYQSDSIKVCCFHCPGHSPGARLLRCQYGLHGGSTRATDSEPVMGIRSNQRVITVVIPYPTGTWTKPPGLYFRIQPARSTSCITTSRNRERSEGGCTTSILHFRQSMNAPAEFDREAALCWPDCTWLVLTSG